MTRVYRFEGISDELELVPLAARRALDHAGLKVSLESWRATPLEVRREVVALGSADRVDVTKIATVLRGASVPSTSIDPALDPDEGTVHPAFLATIDLARWCGLRPVDRYALAKVTRGKHPLDVLPRALAEIAPLSTHVDPSTGAAHMVDVGEKGVTSREAVAHAFVTMAPATVARLRAGDVAKGDVLAVARVAGIQAAKRTWELIPLCHVVALTRVMLDLAVEDDGVAIDARCEARDRTGVEMEALTAASVAALTVYDMLKAVDRGMTLRAELREKRGGKSGPWVR